MADHDLLQQQEQPSAPSPASRHHPTHRIRRRYRRSWDRHGLLAASALCAAFGVGYQAVPIAGWLQYFLLLRFLEVGRRRLRLWVVMWLVRALGWTLALAGSFNNPSFTLSGLVSVLVVCLVISAMETLAAALYVVIGDRYPKRVHAKVLAYPIMMTAFWFFWSLVSPTGSYGHPALCNWPISSIIQLTSLFGLEGILFLMTWTASVLSVALNLLFSPSPFPPSLPPSSHHSRPSDGALEEHEKHGPYYEDGEEEGGEEEGEGEEGEEGGGETEEQEGEEGEEDEAALVARRLRRKAKNQLKSLGWTLLVASLYGGANLVVFHPWQFFQRSLPDTIGSEETVKLACLTATDVRANGSALVWSETEALAALGNDLILWSEEALNLHGSQEEAAALSQAQELSRRYSLYLGIAYHLMQPATKLSSPPPSPPPSPPVSSGSAPSLSSLSPSSPRGLEGGGEDEDGKEEGPYENVFALLTPEGTVGFRYVKRHPVPIIEADALAGQDYASGPPSVPSSTFGRLAGAICFDMDFPQWVRKGGREGVSLLLQPSWTWGPLGQLHAYGSAVRGVENGFNVFRCSSGGLSGYWDSTYTPYALSYTSFKTRTVFSQVTVPRPQSRPTLFSWVGFVFGWLCLAVACGYIIVILGPGEKAMRLAAGRFRRGVGRRSSGSIGGREGGKMEREALVRQRRR